VAARMDMVFPSLKARIPIYAENLNFVTARTLSPCQGTHGVH